MKKAFILLALVVGATLTSPVVEAQMASPKTLTTTSFGLTLDTVSNSGVKVTTPADGLIKFWKTGVTAMVAVTKISGTVGGTLALQGSMDGTNWSTIGSAATPSDGTANYAFNTTVRWYYYRISYTGTGTMSASFKSWLFSY